MKITYKGDYALKIILDLSFFEGKPQPAEEISKREDIPLKFLEQIMMSLKKGGFVKSVRGKKGGYLLTRPASRIKMGEVIRFIDGMVEPIACVCRGGEKTCDYSNRCSLRDVFDDIGKIISDKIDSLNFYDLKERQKKKMAREKKYVDFSI